VLRQIHRLGGGDVVNRDQMVGDELHPTVIRRSLPNAPRSALCLAKSANVSIEAAAAAS
jgi:hypothetical protein